MRNLSRENFIYINKAVIILSILLFLNSCLSIKSDLEINRDLSGSISFNYKVNRSLFTISKESVNQTPLNLDREYLENLTSGNSGLELTRYSTKEDETFIYYESEFSFSSIDDLNRLLPDDNQFTLSRNGDSFKLTQIIASESEAIDSDSMEIYRDIFKNYTVELTVKTPGDIISIDNGIRKNDREAVYQNSIVDILNTSETIDWSINW